MSKLLEFIGYHDLTNWSVAHLLENQFNYNQAYPLVKIGDFLKRNKTQIFVQDDVEYKRVTIKLNNGGIYLRDKKIGKEIGTKKQYLIKEGQFLLSKIDARNGAFGVVTKEVDGAIITGNFWTFDVDYSKINPYFLSLITTTKQFMKFAQSASSGTTGRHYLNEQRFLDVKIPLPPLEKQREIVDAYQSKISLAKKQEQETKEKEKEIEEYLYRELGIVKTTEINNELLEIINFKELTSWSYRDNIGNMKIKSSKYDVVKLSQKKDLYIEIFRGKSPKYAKSKYTILNQKCIRWNDIEIEYAKSVQEEWYKKIDNKFFTKEGDILINSTGDGTIGRSVMIIEEFENLIYDSHILLLRVNKNKINPFFLVEYINSTLGQKQIENIKSAVATKQTELGIGNLKNIQFVLPDVEIQTKIANFISQLKKQTEELKKQAQQNRTSALQEFEKEIFNEN